MSDISRADATSDVAYSRSTGNPDEAQSILMNKVSWGAIFAGVVVALVTQLLLTMLGAGIGLATLDPSTGDNPDASTFSIVAAIWYALTGIIASFTGAYIAARMSGKTLATTGALHGLTTWAFTTLVIMYLLSSGVGSLIGGAFSGVMSAVGGIGQTVAQAAGPVLDDVNPLDAIEGQVRASGTDPEALNTAAVNAVRGFLTSDEESAEAARTQAAQALATARGIPVEEATTQIQGIEEQYRATTDRLQQQAADAADAAASAASTGAISAFIALVLGAIAAWLGGRSGVVHPIYADRVIPSRRSVSTL